MFSTMKVLIIRLLMKRADADTPVQFISPFQRVLLSRCYTVFEKPI